MSLYHYTDASAVLSIVKERELWLTDIRFMNDAEETLDGVKYVMEAVKSLPLMADEHSKRALDILLRFTAQDVAEGLMDEHSFISSFSRTGDHLVQWRSYGLYAIEFDDSLMHDLSPITPCHYEILEKQNLAIDFVRMTRDAISAKLSGGHDEYSHAVQRSIWELADFTTAFKHQSFRDENEVRLIRMESAHSESVNYRVRNNYLIPFVKVAFDLKHIRAIHVGPMKHQDLAMMAMRSFINNIQIRSQNSPSFNYREIKVHASSIPYRPL
ncbi:hypothetical protein [Pseudomonas syringae group sp. J309-1]|uniref:hypothetical protein n=1 Tax=Pseudomonas syringae group sp. J309-1 TaxID=3079588 RepID=UPI00290E8CF0|nr:hypothetical protein [Pseudomonas syringae group sp. J309-1]MDU8359963.1 hypothetical protein [Pseudomonas syringae group sp. J309-1]